MRDKNTKLTSKYEILAPAGSYTCMVAAFNAGADAVYLGGGLFGARASANNFSKEELLEALEYAHLRGKKIFLTVNTLLKSEQLKCQLYDYIEPLYRAGLDAVIVQDFGVLKFIKEHFPNIDIHASTQMTVTGVEFAKELKELGVSRIVPARELSYKEINAIYNATKLEIECFVHGALCYCYSGMCLLSSVIGGRSGNRGRCAQPCRLPYDVIFANSNKNEKVNISGEYPLSPADLCTLNNIPDILESGVYSLKIEGRMKKPEYVASVTAMYRKYVDMYERIGRSGYKVDKNDIEKLKDIYNRGEFTDGYYKRHNGSQIMSVKRPNHMGTKAAIILEYNKKKQEITAKALEEIHDNDVLEIFLKDGQSVFVKAVNSVANKIFTTKLMQKTTLEIDKMIERLIEKENGKYIMRTRNNSLISDIEQKYISNDISGRLTIGGSVVVSKDMPIMIDVWYEDVYSHVEGGVPYIAENRPITSQDIEKQIKKTGSTDFVFDENDLTISVDDGLFINIKELNQLRRSALEELSIQLKKKSHQVYLDRKINDKTSINIMCNNLSENSALDKKRYMSVYVSTVEQFDVAVNSKCEYIAFEMDICHLDNSKKTIDTWNSLIEKAHRHNKEIFMCLPYIFREHGKKYLSDNIVFFKDNSLDGYVFRNMEEIALFDNLEIDKKKAVFDNTIYGFNDVAVSFLMEYNPYLITASFELNMHELNSINCNRLEICTYGYIPVMISAGCIKKTYGRCDSLEDVTILKDRLGNFFKCKNHCTFCYNVIYNSKPLKLTDIAGQLNDRYVCEKYIFTTESGLEVKQILEGNMEMEFTRGHFKRGVE